MAKGKSKIKFIGGFLDGESMDNIDSRGIISELSQTTGKWFRDVGDNIEVKNNGEPDSQWIGYETHVYKKGCKDENGYFKYKFDQPVIVERCKSITKSGSQCMKSCYKNLSFCETHKN